MDNKNIQLNIDTEFWTDFVQEAFEHIEEIEINVLTLEKEPEHEEIIHTMFRAFHTIKGLSGFVEHTIIQEIAHKTETLMDFCRKGEMKVDKTIVDAILKSSDFIKQLCEDIDSAKNADYVSQISEHINFLEATAINHLENNNTTQETPEEKEIIKTEEELTIENTQEVEPQAEIIEEQNTPEVIQEDCNLDKTETTETEIEIKAEPQEIEPTPTEPQAAKISQETVKPSVIPQEPPQQTKNKNQPEEYMKVATSKIDHLVDMIGELIINQSLIDQYVETNYSHDNKFITTMGGFSRITRELQDLSMFLRMVSLKPTFQKLTRIARDTIQELHKDVDFVTIGEATEIDRVVTDKLLDPLVHLIKNAISHGVEPNPDDRTKLDKPRKAKVELIAYNKRGSVYIEIKDDGRGINPKVVYEKALEKGLIDSNREYTEEEIKEFILLPGFSTAEVVDNISGRGVGMDVVKTQILKLGGKVDIKSELNKGTIFTLKIPVNHAIMNGTVIEISGQNLIIPTMNVKEIFQPKENDWIYTQQNCTMIKVRENIIPIIPINLLFKDIYKQKTMESPLVLILESEGKLSALPITNVINRQEVVVKPVREEFVNLKYISGMSILGNGRVSLILDIDYLFTMEAKE